MPSASISAARVSASSATFAALGLSPSSVTAVASEFTEPSETSFPASPSSGSSSSLSVSAKSTTLALFALISLTPDVALESVGISFALTLMMTPWFVMMRRSSSSVTKNHGKASNVLRNGHSGRRGNGKDFCVA